MADIIWTSKVSAVYITYNIDGVIKSLCTGNFLSFPQTPSVFKSPVPGRNPKQEALLAQRAERRRQEVERRRREREEEERKQWERVQTEEKLKNELEEDRRKRAEELRSLWCNTKMLEESQIRRVLLN